MSTSVDAVLKNLSETKRVFTKITDLRIYELYDPGLLDGLKMTFPNLKTLALDTLHKMELGGMELGVVLEACTNLDMKLDRLDLWLPAYPERMRDVIDGLLKGDKLYKDLNRIEIRPHIRNRTRHDLTYAEKYLFKGLLAELEGMDQIVIHGLYFGDESLKNLRDFMASNEMPESKFNVLQVGWTDDDEERDGSDSE